MLQQRKCQVCGSLFMGGPRAFYCPSCRREIYLERHKEYNRRQKCGTTRKIGSIDKCQRCDKEYIVIGSLQRFCPECQPIHALEYDRVTSLKYYHQNKQKINPVRYDRRKIELINCLECGKLFDPQGTCRRYCSRACKRIRYNRIWMNRYYPKNYENKKGPRN